jgi:3-hydroxyisobutyrate dehydrogenase-like beta-hydroxyacid dehydrogenase
MMKIAMLGIGMMGLGIATHLQPKGHKLALFEHSGNQPLFALKVGGAQGFMSATKAMASVSLNQAKCWL